MNLEKGTVFWDGWFFLAFEVIGDSTVADAILDRLVHNAHRLELKGDLLKKEIDLHWLKKDN